MKWTKSKGQSKRESEKGRGEEEGRENGAKAERRFLELVAPQRLPQFGRT